MDSKTEATQTTNPDETALTSRLDRDKNKRYRPSATQDTLTSTEAQDAVQQLYYSFPRVERYYADPPIPMQQFGLVSFIPSQTAIPDADGIYGMMKIRGVYATDTEARNRAEYLVKEVDSSHRIYQTYIGRPFPITSESKFSQSVDQVETSGLVEKTREESAFLSDFMKKDMKRFKEKMARDKEQAAERVQALVADSNQEDMDRTTIEYYITKCVTRANLVHVFQEVKNTMDMLRSKMSTVSSEIQQLDSDYPDYPHQYLNHFHTKRKEVGLSPTEAFVQFMDISTEKMNQLIHEKI